MANHMTLEVFERSFQDVSLADFCQRYGVSYLPAKGEVERNQLEMERFTDSLEDQGVSYFYVSYSEADIWNAFQEERSVDMKHYDFVRVQNGICLAILR